MEGIDQAKQIKGYPQGMKVFRMKTYRELIYTNMLTVKSFFSLTFQLAAFCLK